MIWLRPLLVAMLAFLSALGFGWLAKEKGWFSSWDLVSRREKKIGYLSGPIHGDGPWVEVTKWQSHQGITIRIVLNHFDLSGKSEPELQVFHVPSAIEGHITYQGRFINLALVNMDDDPWLEILVPFFEPKLLGRAYVLKYDPHIRQFLRLNDRE
ncbi:MAG: hypothetical protein NZ480_00815 [Bdellovibrionaceae bacterium]|nr:hypothetical protein [Pseudobdellovibrionaceae bacterium]MDW8189886.1 hypothetical protein [Pseudobdellovibrionaceae bacterium]